MSVIQRIRDKGAWIMFALIALALIAFNLQDRALGGGRGSFFSGNTTTIGKVNGEVIERKDFEDKVAMAEKYGQQQGAGREQAVASAWNQEVSTIILQQECDKLGLTVSGKEFSDILFDPMNSPLKREFTDPKTGEFNIDAAKQAFAQLKKSKNQEQMQMLKDQLVDPTIQQTLYSKYNALLQGSIYVPKWMIEKQQADNNVVSSISYVGVPYSSIADSAVKVSDDDILAYARKHKKEYERDDESRTINYVAFDASATSADSAAAFTDLNNQKTAFVAATDMKEYFSRNSTDLPYYDGLIGKKQIQQPVKDSLFKLSVGQTYGPYVDGANYVIAKMVSERSIPDTVKVRHILVATTQRDQSGATQRVREDSTAKKTIDSAVAFINSGAKWDSICAKYSDDGGSKDKGGVYDNIAANGGMVPEFSDFAFTGKTGEKKVVKTTFGYHYIEILSQKGNQEGYKIAYISKPIVASNETISTASTAAAQFAATSKNIKLFNENALKQNKPNQPSSEVKENDFTIPGLGSSRQIVRWMYQGSVGDVSEPFEVGDRYVVAIITAVNKAGLPSVATLRQQVEPMVRNEKKAQQIIETKFKGNTLEALAASAGTSVAKADSVSFASAFIPGVGNEPKLIGAAFNKGIQGKVSQPIAGSNGVYAIMVNNIGAVSNANSIPEGIKQNILQSQRMALYRGGDALRKAATIKDNRSKFY